MAVTAGTVRVEVEADASHFQDAIRKANDLLNKLPAAAGAAAAKLEGMSAAMSKAAKEAGKLDALKDFGAGLAKHAGLAAAAIGALGVYTAKSAEDFAELGDEIERAFGDRAPAMKDFADALSRDLGVAALDARKAVADLGMQLTQQLGSTEAAEAQSRALVQLAADLAAAKNVPFAEAMGAVSAAARGATRGLASFGIILKDDELAQAGLALGIQDATSKMSQQEQTAARLAAMLEQGAKYAGEAAKDTGTLGTQSAVAREALGALGRDLGALVLPHLIAATKSVNEFLRTLNSLSPTTKEWIGKAIMAAGAAAAFAAALGGLIVVIAKVADGIAVIKALGMGKELAFIGSVAGPAALAVGVFAASFTIASVALEEFGVKNTGARGAVIALDSALDTAGEGARGFAKVVINAWLAVAEALFVLFELIPGVGPMIKDAFESARAAADRLLTAEENAAGTTAHLQEQFEATQRTMKEAAEATGDMSTELDANGQSMGAATEAGATLAERVAWEEKQQRLAETATRDHTKALEEQRKAFNDLNDAIKDVQSQAEIASSVTPEITGILQERRAAEAGIAARAMTAGQDPALVLSSIADDFDRLVIKKLADHLASLPVEQLAFAFGDAVEVVEAMGHAGGDLIAANAALAQTADDLGGGFQGITGEVYEAKAALASFSMSAQDLLKGMATAGSAGGAVTALAGAGGAAIGMALGDPTGEIGGIIGSLLGGVLGDALDALIESLGVVRPLFDAVGVVMRAFGPALVPVRTMFEALGAILISMVPAVSLVAQQIGALGSLQVDFYMALALGVIAVITFATLLIQWIDVIGQRVREFERAFITPTLQGLEDFVNVLVTIANQLLYIFRDLTNNQDFGEVLKKVDIVAGRESEDADGPRRARPGAFNPFDPSTWRMVDVPLKNFGDAVADAASGLDEMNASMTNVPQGFKVATARFRAIVADDFGGGSAAPTPGAPGTGATGRTVIIENVDVRASTLDEIIAQVEEAAEQAAFRNTGTTGTIDAQWRGKGR